MKRRQFIKRVAQTAAALSAASAVSTERVLGANERVRVGLIGCGGRGLFDAKIMRDGGNVEFVAGGGFYSPHLGRAKERGGASAQTPRTCFPTASAAPLIPIRPKAWTGTCISVRRLMCLSTRIALSGPSDGSGITAAAW